ncbi:MAG: hypothetical protein AB7G80_09805 [Dongiaceae bacterium]
MAAPHFSSRTGKSVNRPPAAAVKIVSQVPHAVRRGLIQIALTHNARHKDLAKKFLDYSAPYVEKPWYRDLRLMAQTIEELYADLIKEVTKKEAAMAALPEQPALAENGGLPNPKITRVKKSRERGR